MTSLAGKPRHPMKNTGPIFNPATHYRIEVLGRFDAEWLKSFDGLVEISVDEERKTEEITVLDVHTDQSGIVGLVRRLHGLNITILQFHIISEGGKAAEGEE